MGAHDVAVSPTFRICDLIRKVFEIKFGFKSFRVALDAPCHWRRIATRPDLSGRGTHILDPSPRYPSKSRIDRNGRRREQGIQSERGALQIQGKWYPEPLPRPGTDQSSEGVLSESFGCEFWQGQPFFNKSHQSTAFKVCNARSTVDCGRHTWYQHKLFWLIGTSQNSLQDR